ncbi:Alpha/Beta hydrolase protein [Lasiosphaeris hirsuta]|uniref:Alpha/Beta hydrolase protein n=1 Tax=Lasiosphaeris hirsuta TaxID=260670 RepID=A0AA40AG01_9PEZI|nr:Alpha/Beta hydrolase protein [Lasiosphaeris hirsuta]
MFALSSVFLLLGAAITAQAGVIPTASTTNNPAAPTSTSKAFVPLYKTLPATPVLPPNARFQGTANVNNIELWYTLYGPPPKLSKREPVVLLHGSQMSSRWLGAQIKHLIASQKDRTIIAIDTRAHGRSTDDLSVPLTYDLFASDAAALLKQLGIKRAAVFGWSDGGNTAVALAMGSSASLVERAYVYGANANPDQVNVTGIMTAPFWDEHAARMRAEYEAIAPVPAAWDTFSERIEDMQSALPQWTGADLGKIKTRYEDPENAPIVWFSGGDSEEVISRYVPGTLRDSVWGSSLVILPEVGHYGPVEDPATLNAVLDRWLAKSRY